MPLSSVTSPTAGKRVDAPRRRLPPEQYDELRARARELYLAGLSYRDIAAQLGMNDGGYVQVARWVKKFGWAAEREEQTATAKAVRKSTYLARVAGIQEAHLRLAEKVRQVAIVALDQYCVKDEAGNVTAVKVNPRTGLPAINPLALQMMITGAAELERKALGFELLPPGDMETASTSTIVDATPIHDSATLRRIGDFLARQTLETTLVIEASPSLAQDVVEPVQGATVEDKENPQQ